MCVCVCVCLLLRQTETSTTVLRLLRNFLSTPFLALLLSCGVPLLFVRNRVWHGAAAERLVHLLRTERCPARVMNCLFCLFLTRAYLCTRRFLRPCFSRSSRACVCVCVRARTRTCTRMQQRQIPARHWTRAAGMSVCYSHQYHRPSTQSRQNMWHRRFSRVQQKMWITKSRPLLLRGGHRCVACAVYVGKATTKSVLVSPDKVIGNRTYLRNTIPAL